MKVLIIFTTIFVIGGACAAIHIINKNSNDTILTAVQAEQDLKSNIPEDTIEEIVEETIQIAEEPSTEDEEEEEKTVKYGDKEIKIQKSKVAAVNEKEDAEVKKTGGEQMSAAEAIDKFENDGQSVGIDVSKHQGKINWAAVKNSGIEFAMIRVGFRGNSESGGAIYEDTYFKTNINGAVSNGIKVGIYFYSTAINETEALEEAAWVVDKIKSYRITYPVVYDFEDFGRYRCKGVSGEQATSNAIAFLNYVRSAGYTPMMYANKNDITNRFNKSRLSGYKFWLAHYTSQTNYTGTYHMWQYTSSGTVDGISGRVDMNVAYFRYGAVAEPKHTCDFDNGTVIKTNDSKAATCTENGLKYIRCASCSESKQVVIPKLGHKLSEWEYDEENGIRYKTCITCKEIVEKEDLTKDDNTNTTNTTNTSSNNTSSSTNTSNGTGENDPTLTCEHTFDAIKEEKASTCGEPGYKIYKCSKCGLEGEKQTIEATGNHSYGNWTIVNNPTTEKEGLEEKICTVCGDKKTQVIDKLPSSDQSSEENNTVNTIEN